MPVTALRRYRKNRALKQSELARLIDVQQSSISNYEIGKTKPTSRRVKRTLEETFGVPLSTLLAPDARAIKAARRVSLVRAAKTADRPCRLLRSLFTPTRAPKVVPVYAPSASRQPKGSPVPGRRTDLSFCLVTQRRVQSLYRVAPTGAAQQAISRVGRRSCAACP